MKSAICWYSSVNSSSNDILETCPGHAITMITVHSRQAGPQKMPGYIGELSLKGGNTSPKTSSTMLLTTSWVPVQRWNKLGWNVSYNFTTEDMAKETPVPGIGCCKKNKLLDIIWNHVSWERSNTFYPVALIRCKQYKVQGDVKPSSIFQVLLVIKWLCPDRSLQHLSSALHHPQGFPWSPKVSQVSCETAVYPGVGPWSTQRHHCGGSVQNAALRWENVGGTGWEGSINVQRDGQTGGRALRHRMGFCSGRVSRIWEMVQLLPAALPQDWWPPQRNKKLGPLSCLNKGTCQNKGIEMWWGERSEVQKQWPVRRKRRMGVVLHREQMT